MTVSRSGSEFLKRNHSELKLLIVTKNYSPRESLERPNN